MKFHLGTGLLVDLEVLVDTRLLVQANSGGGKSRTIRRLLEQTHGKVQHLVLDPEGEFASLRERFDYVLAARGAGETAADPRSARLLAERLLQLGVSAILDVYELRPHERVEFVKEFLEALVDAPKSLWHPCLVVVDEAHVYCPEKGEAASAGAVKDLTTRGRKRGFSAVLATQRLSKLHKDAAAECNNKLIGRTSLDVDMKRAADELGLSRGEDQRALRTLEPGEFFAFGPAMQGGSGVIRTLIGQVSTTHPKSGARLAVPVPPPSSRVLELLPRLADLPAEATRKRKTEEDLRAEVRSLQGELARAKAAKSPPERGEVPVVPEAQVRGVAAAARELREAGEAADRLGRDLVAALHRAAPHTRSSFVLTGGGTVTFRAAKTEFDAAVVEQKTAPPPSRAARKALDGAGLTGPEQRILDAAAWLHGLGVEAPAETGVAFLAGYRPNGGAYLNPRATLVRKGLVLRARGTLSLTPAGRALAAEQEFPASDREVHEKVLVRLSGPERRILRPLLAAWPASVPNDRLAEEAQYAPDGGAYLNPRGRLRSLGLIEYGGGGLVRARDLLFPVAGGGAP